MPWQNPNYGANTPMLVSFTPNLSQMRQLFRRSVHIMTPCIDESYILSCGILYFPVRYHIVLCHFISLDDISFCLKVFSIVLRLFIFLWAIITHPAPLWFVLSYFSSSSAIFFLVLCHSIWSCAISYCLVASCFILYHYIWSCAILFCPVSFCFVLCLFILSRDILFRSVTFYFVLCLIISFCAL